MKFLSYIALGANLGQPQEALGLALQNIRDLKNVTLQKYSSLYVTAPIQSSGPDYANAVIAVTTSLTPHELLFQLQKIEKQFGRMRLYRNAPRTLDLDILTYGCETISTKELEIPHPRMSTRAFVLVPLHEIAPEMVANTQLVAIQDQSIRRVTWPVLI
jgi:2-amino-4-hydroxy-6-hydroxymethyldihydropteridine diphosphokinase